MASDVGSKTLGHIHQNDGCLIMLGWVRKTLVGHMPSVKILASSQWTRFINLTFIHFEELGI